MEEAYSREESSIGWWPQSEAPGPAFYAYTYPEPDGYRSASIHPPESAFDARLGLFLLPHEAARISADPDAAVLDFFRSTYAAGADLGGWDRRTLEPSVHPGQPPHAPWSTLKTT
jgi:hypothetical protein